MGVARSCLTQPLERSVAMRVPPLVSDAPIAPKAAIETMYQVENDISPTVPLEPTTLVYIKYKPSGKASDRIR